MSLTVFLIADGMPATIPEKIIIDIPFPIPLSVIMWLWGAITGRGIGNGISIIIFSGIVAGIPSAIKNTVRLMNTGEIQFFVLLGLLVLMVLVVGAIVFMESGQKRIPVQYAKRVVGRKMYGGQSTHLPLKVN